MDKATLQAQLIQLKAKVYDLNGMKDQVINQITMFNNQIGQVSQEIERLDKDEKSAKTDGKGSKPADSKKADTTPAPAATPASVAPKAAAKKPKK